MRTFVYFMANNNISDDYRHYYIMRLIIQIVDSNSLSCRLKKTFVVSKVLSNNFCLHRKVSWKVS